MTTRRKPKPAKPTGHGGDRKGAGRKPLGEAKRIQHVKPLLTRAEIAAAEAVVAAENDAVDDGRPATVHTWARDLILNRLGLPSPDAE